MTDNVKVDPGTGGGSPLVATDDLGGGVQVQRVKLMLGADGVNDGDVAAGNKMPVVDANLGAMADTQATDDTSSWSLIALFKRLLGKFSTLATFAKQDTGNASLASIDGKITAVNTGAVTVSSSALPAGAATAAKQPALGAATTANSTPVNIASDQTVPVSAASLPLPTGAATAAKQPALGAATTANSTPVNIASDQTVPVSAASLPLPTGAATAAKQPALGAATTANSTPVNIASDQTVPVSAASLPLPTGAATAANQATEISSLSTLVAGITLTDFSIALRNVFLWALNRFVAVEPNSGRVRVVLDAAAGAQTLGTVTTVGTVTAVTTVTTCATLTNQAQIGGMPIRDAQITPLERMLASNSVRRLIT